MKPGWLRSQAYHAVVGLAGKEVPAVSRTWKDMRGVRGEAPQAGDGVSGAEAAIAMVRIFGALLVVVGLVLLTVSVLQDLGGN